MCSMTMGYETRESPAQAQGARSQELGLRPCSCERMASPIHAITREAVLGSRDVTDELAVVRFHCMSVAWASRVGTPHLTAMQRSWDDWLGLPGLSHDGSI